MFCERKSRTTAESNEHKVGKTQAASQAKSSDVVWVICRALTSRQSTQVVLPWAGWVSKTETTRKSQQSTVDYMSPIFAPITENSTVQHLLKVSQEASREVQQSYKVVTFDLAVARKAYSLVWQNLVVFSNVIVRLGSFHLLCGFMCALGKMFRCSGFEEVLVRGTQRGYSSKPLKVIPLK